MLLVPVGVLDGFEPEAFGEADEFTVPVEDMEPVVEPLPVRPRMEPDREPMVLEVEPELMEPVSGAEPEPVAPIVPDVVPEP